MNTAVDDGMIRRNPCRIRGAGLDRSPERSVLTIRQVTRLADAIGPRYRLVILLAVYGSLRWASWLPCGVVTSTWTRARRGLNDL
jgi:hypothetical protein